MIKRLSAIVAQCILLASLSFNGGCIADYANGQYGKSVTTQLRKAEDAVDVTTTRDATVVSVISKSGIGGATLVRLGETWPTSIMIRLKFNNLQGFQFTVDDKGTVTAINYTTAIKKKK